VIVDETVGSVLVVTSSLANVLVLVATLSVEYSSTIIVLRLNTVICSVTSAWNVSMMIWLGPEMVVVRSTCEVVDVSDVTVNVAQDSYVSTHCCEVVVVATGYEQTFCVTF